MEGNLAIFKKCTSFDLAFLRVFPKEIISIARKMFIIANLEYWNIRNNLSIQ